MTQYPIMDAFTFRHLRMWCERFAPVAGTADKDELFEQMTRFVQSIDPDDAVALMNRGWTAVYDEMEARHE